MRNVWEELRHNLASGILITLILAVQFGIFFWQGTTVASYFLDTNGDDVANHVVEGYTYYPLMYATSNDEQEEALWNQFSDPDFVGNAAKTYRALHEDPSLHFLAFNSTAISLDFEQMQSRFTTQELLDFFCNSKYQGYYQAGTTDVESLTIPVQFPGMSVGFETHSYCLDYPSLQHFNFQVSQGRLLEEKDFEFNWGQKEIPILVGSAYAAGLQVGDVVDAAVYSGVYQLRVVGILEEHTGILTDQIFIQNGGKPEYLDYTILVPFFNISSAPGDEAEETFASSNYEMALQGMIVLDEDATRADVLRVEKKINQIFVQNGLYPISTSTSPYGLSVFRTESVQTVQVMVGLSVLMGVLSVSGICMSVIAKLNRNLHRYGIEMMNGQSAGTILAAFLLEILLVIAAGMGFAVWNFSDLIAYHRIFLWVILALGLILAAAVSLIFIRRLRKVDIEEIIRRNE